MNLQKNILSIKLYWKEKRREENVYLKSTNWTSDASKNVFGKGLGWGDKTVRVCFSISTLVLKRKWSLNNSND